MSEDKPEPDLLDRFSPTDAQLTQHRAWVGQIAGIWAVLEHLIDSFAITLAKISHNFGYCFTSQVAGPARKLDSHIALARLLGAEEFMKELDAFAKDTIALAERRNRVIHDPWIILDKLSPIRAEVTARRIVRNRIVPVTEIEMDKLTTDLSSHLTRFLDIHGRIMAAIGT
jgi:hypothetical protein